MKLLKAWPCVLSAALLLMAFPPVRFPLLVVVALAPWIASLRGLNGRSAWRSGYCFGVFYGFGSLLWIGSLSYRWTGSLLLGFIPWILACFVYALYFGLAGVLIQRCWSRNWPWMIPVVWAGVEVFRSFIPTFAFPWALLAEPLSRYPALIQGAHYGTIFFISAVVMLANVAIVLALSGETRRPAWCLAGVAAVTVASVLRYSMPETGHPLVVSAIQPGVDMAFESHRAIPGHLRQAIPPLIDRALQDRTQLILLPEGVAEAPEMPPDLPFAMPKVPFLVGARRGINPAFESAMSYDSGKWSFVDKTRLVVFGEFVPFRQYLPFITSAFRLPTGDMVAGLNGTQAVNLAGYTMGPVICFEEMFPDVAYKQALNGARMLPVISIDDFFMDSNAPQELRAGAIWRAIETGLPMVRSASTGYTMAVDGKGHALGHLPLRTSDELTVTVTIPDHSPLFPPLPVFPAVSFLAAVGMLLFGRVPKAGSAHDGENSEIASTVAADLTTTGRP